MIRRFEYVERLSGHPAMGFAILANAELIASRAADEEVCQVAWDDHAVVAYDRDELVGILTYAVLDWRSGVAIKLAYVRPAYRRRGTYRELWNRLVTACRGKGIRRIEGTVGTENAAMRAVAARLGRSETSVNLSFTVPPEPSP